MDFEEWWEEEGQHEPFNIVDIAKAAWNAALKSQWRTMESAPRDGTRVDLWAKCWTSHNDKWIYLRFPNCYWTQYEQMDNASPEWVNLNKEWYPTHWMPIPEPPENLNHD